MQFSSRGELLNGHVIGLIINLNVATAAHWDSKDDGVCLALVIVDYNHDGGKLVLYELGLVVPLANGDFTILSSCKLAHFIGTTRDNMYP